jgi:hypothetical protein
MCAPNSDQIESLVRLVNAFMCTYTVFSRLTVIYSSSLFIYTIHRTEEDHVVSI